MIKHYNNYKDCGVYRIVNIENGKIYIGSSKKCRGRQSRHFNKLNKNLHKNLKLQNAYNKLQHKTNMRFEMIIFCKETDLKYYEQSFIDNLNPEYNISKIAERPDFNEETRSKIAITVGQYQRSLGENHSSKRPETREKIRASLKGKPKSLESIEKQKITKSSPFYISANKKEDKRKKHSDILIAKGDDHASKRPEVRRKMKSFWHTQKAFYLIWWRTNVWCQLYWGA